MPDKTWSRLVHLQHQFLTVRQSLKGKVLRDFRLQVFTNHLLMASDKSKAPFRFFSSKIRIHLRNSRCTAGFVNSGEKVAHVVDTSGLKE
jgi:hypothetical protein